MHYLCLRGHASSEPDYCSECGGRMPANPPQTNPQSHCPECGAPRALPLNYCEVCRHSFTVTAEPELATPSPQLKAPPPAMLKLVILVDPSLCEPELASTCPSGTPPREFHLDLDEHLLGRRSNSRGIYPEIEIPDPGVSHRHLKFLRQPDGSVTALDLGSANGTRLNNRELPPGVATPVSPGDELTLGLWTRLEIHSRNHSGGTS